MTSSSCLISFFAYDTLIFCEANHINCHFLCFEVVLGLKINLAKLIGALEDFEGLAHILACRMSLKYRGLPLGAPLKAKSI